MIYGQDEPVLFPTMDLYDQGAMQMYITALRDQYQQGLKDQEDFYTKFGDFTSPIAKDVEQWDKRVVSPVTDMIDAMYAQGIDPVRNPEARQMILRQIHKTPRSWANKARERAKAADEYVKNRAALQRAGRWSSDFEKFRLGGKTLETWDPEVDGEWTETSPAEYQTLQEFVHPSFAQLKPRALSQEDVEHRGGELFPELNYQYNPMYDYTGITEGDMRRSLEQYLPGIMGNPTYDYYYDIARRQVAAETGNANPSEKDVYKRFVDNAIQADSQVLNPFDYDINKIALADYEHRQRMAEAFAKPSSRRTSYGGGDDEDPIIIPQLTSDISYHSIKNARLKQNSIEDVIMDLIDSYESQPKTYVKTSGLNIGSPSVTGAVQYTSIKELSKRSKLNQDNARFWRNKLNSGDFDNLIKYDKDGKVVGYSDWFQKILDRQLYNLKNADDNKKRAFAERNYNKYIIDMGGTDNNILLNETFGDKKVRNDYFTEPYVSLPLKSAKLHYAPVRKLNSMSNGRFSEGSIEDKFDKWINSGVAGDAYLVNRSVGSAYINGDIDLSINPDISKKQFENFLRSIGENTDDATKSRIASRLGLGVVTKEGNVFSTNDGKKAEYYRVPVIKTLDDATLARVNVSRNKVNYGVTASLNLTPDAYAAAEDVQK